MSSIDETYRLTAGPGERRLILIDGAQEWCLDTARALCARLAPRRMVWLSNAPLEGAIAPTKVQQLLGGECELLVIDAWSGFDADALGAAVGTLRGGGLLLLLTPPLAHWGEHVDPEAARIAVYPYSAAAVGTRFISRLARLLLSSPTVLRAHIGTEGTPAPAKPTAERLLRVLADRGAYPPVHAADLDPTRPATADQTAAVKAILRVARGRARRPLVVSADRGRGKSAALGLAAAQLTHVPGQQVLITAPRRQATETLFFHAQASLRASKHEPVLPNSPASLQDGQVSQNHQANAQPGDGALRFLAPDALLAQRPHADLLIVDEAAGIPAPLLEQMLTAYPRICFATTVHGYEGTGRGFEVRFRALLDQHTPHWRALRLSAPIRWRPGDPLEVLTAQALLLDAEPASDERITAADFGADLSAVRVARPARAQLAADEARLRQVFGLLVLGHYQTRPNDLRHLLDGPNLAVTTLEVDQQVVATALLAQEGALDSALHWPIFAGQRRPRGHLLPQTLCAHAGLREAPGLRYLRIVRIAVHPAARRRGLGRRLLAATAEHAAEAGVDLLGASFGATPELLAFWRHAGLRPLHLGTHRNAASGTRAAVVLKPLSQAGRMLCAQAEQRLQRDLPLLLSGPLHEVEPALVAALLQALPAAPAPPETAADHATIAAFADAHRTLEASLPALARLSWRALTGADAERACSAAQRALLIRVLLQRQPPAAAAQQAGLSGHAELIAHLRQAVGAASRHLGGAL